MSDQEKNEEAKSDSIAGSEDESSSGSEQDRQKPLSWLEKAATALSCLLIGALFTVLARDALARHSPAAFSVVTGKPDIVRESYRIPIRVYNTGDMAARTVMVHVEVKGADTVFSEADLTLDWLPGKSSHSVIGYLKRPSAPHSIDAEVTGYSDP